MKRNYFCHINHSKYAIFYGFRYFEKIFRGIRRKHSIFYDIHNRKSILQNYFGIKITPIQSVSAFLCIYIIIHNDPLKPNQNIFVNLIHKYIVPIYVSEFRICTAFQTEKISTNGQKYKNHFLPGAWHERKGWPCGPIWCT